MIFQKTGVILFDVQHFPQYQHSRWREIVPIPHFQVGGPSAHVLESLLVSHKPVSKRAKLFYKRGRYSKKDCTHLKGETATISLSSARFYTSCFVGSDQRIQKDGRVGVTTDWFVWQDKYGRLCVVSLEQELIQNNNQNFSAWYVDEGVLYEYTSGWHSPSYDWFSWFERIPRKGSRANTSWNLISSREIDDPISAGRLPDLVRRLVPGVQTSRDQIWSQLPLDDLADRALKNYTGPNMSWLETLIPIPETDELLKQFLKVPRTWKELAGQFLAYKYGIAPWKGTMQDLADTYNKIVHHAAFPDQVVTLSSGGTYKVQNLDVKVTCTIRARVANALVLNLAHLGAADPFTEIWNCIPYSFAIDWFLNVGYSIDRLETQAQWRSLELLEICFSCKVSGLLTDFLGEAFTDPDVSTQGDITFYERRYLTQLPDVNYFRLPDILGNIRQHWAEGLALVIQRAPGQW